MYVYMYMYLYVYVYMCVSVTAEPCLKKKNMLSLSLKKKKKKEVFCDTVVEPFSRELLLVVRHTAFQALKHLLMFIHLCTCIYMFESCVFISYSVFRVFLFQITKVVFT